MRPCALRDRIRPVWMRSRVEARHPLSMPTSLPWYSTLHHAIGRQMVRFLGHLPGRRSARGTDRPRDRRRTMPPYYRDRYERLPTRACSRRRHSTHRRGQCRHAGRRQHHQRQPPAWTADWQLATDLSSSSGALYPEPGPADEFRNFVLPLPLTSTAFVRGIEVRPGARRSPRDHRDRRTRRFAAADDADLRPGDGAFQAHVPTATRWTPGMTPRLDPQVLHAHDPGSDLVVHRHMMRPRARAGQCWRSRSTSRPPRPIASRPLRLGSKTIDIPAGDLVHAVTDTLRTAGRRSAPEHLSACKLPAKEMKCLWRCPVTAPEQLLDQAMGLPVAGSVSLRRSRLAAEGNADHDGLYLRQLGIEPYESVSSTGARSVRTAVERRDVRFVAPIRRIA